MYEHDLILMSALIFAPAAFGLGCLLLPKSWLEFTRWFALTGSVVTLILSLILLVDYYNRLDFHRGPKTLNDHSSLLEARVDEAARRAALELPGSREGYDCYASVPWVEKFNINYEIGVDGLSLPLIVLTTIIFVVSVLASWSIQENIRVYFAFLLILETGVLGVFHALDLFLFYVFYEVMLIPMYFLIGLWGGARRKYAAMKFVIYTLVGSVLLLVAIILLSFVEVRDYFDKPMVDTTAAIRKRESPNLVESDARSMRTFSIPVLQRVGQVAMLELTGQAHRIAAKPKSEGARTPRWDPKPRPDGQIELLGREVPTGEAKSRRADDPIYKSSYQYLIFILLFVGFAIKVPLIPLHSWLPDAHVEAPTPISMILAGVLLKLGGYGIFRIAYPICPYAAHELSGWIAGLGAFAIIYGALVCLGQTDFKRLLAYSSISHMGYVILGLGAWTGGGAWQYWAWAMNGAVYQMIAHGITSAAMFFIVGVVYERAHHRDLNGLGGLWASMPFFGGVALLLFFASMGLPGLCGFVGELLVVLGAWKFSPVLTILAILSTVLTAGYLLWAWQRVFLGTNPNTAHYPDLSLREAIILLTLLLLAIALGVFPQTLVLNWSEGSITGLAESLSLLTR